MSRPGPNASTLSWPKEVEATLNQYLAAGLIQRSNSPYSSLLGVISKKCGGVRITVNYKNLNKISSLSQLSIPRVDQVLDYLGKGRVFSLFDWVPSFHPIVHKDTVTLTAFCTPTGLYEWLIIPQGNSASPEWCSSRLSTRLSRAWNWW